MSSPTTTPEQKLSKPTLSRFERLVRPLVPEFLRPNWETECLFYRSLRTFEPPVRRTDIRLEWVSRWRDLTTAQVAFMKMNVSRAARWQHYLQMRQRQVWMCFAWWGGAIQHRSVVQLAGRGAFRRYGALLLPNSVYLGPAYTLPAARGHGIYPYVFDAALARARQGGYEHAYTTIALTNTASLRGVDKQKTWTPVGQLLMRRRVGQLGHRLRRAVIDLPAFTKQVPLSLLQACVQSVLGVSLMIATCVD